MKRPGRESPCLVNMAAWSDINRSSSTSVSDLRVLDKSSVWLSRCVGCLT